jgi:hypothetical protein
MAVTAFINQRPISQVASSPLIKSRWIAGWNPVFYKFQVSGLVDPSTVLVVSVYEYGTNTLLGKDNYKVRNGLLSVDISGILRSYLYSSYSPSFEDGINCIDFGNSINAYIKYQLVSATTSEVEVSDESNYIYVCNAAKQIGEAYGQNMAEYVPYGIEGIMKAKFLTKFEEPVFFIDYPFTISFIYSENIIGHELKLIEDKLDINGTELDDDETELDITQGHYVNHLKLSPYSIENKYVDISLSTGQPVDDLYVYEGYVTTGYTEAR